MDRSGLGRIKKWYEYLLAHEAAEKEEYEKAKSKK